MKHVVTFLLLALLMWDLGTAWCVLAGLHPDGDAQLAILVFVVLPLAAAGTSIVGPT